MAKPPAKAFDFYVNLESDRTYEAVAEEFDVSERTVRRWAVKDRP